MEHSRLNLIATIIIVGCFIAIGLLNGQALNDCLSANNGQNSIDACYSAINP